MSGGERGHREQRSPLVKRMQPNPGRAGMVYRGIHLEENQSGGYRLPFKPPHGTGLVVEQIEEPLGVAQPSARDDGTDRLIELLGADRVQTFQIDSDVGAQPLRIPSGPSIGGPGPDDTLDGQHGKKENTDEPGDGI